jgi:hypothetical protein
MSGVLNEGAKFARMKWRYETMHDIPFAIVGVGGEGIAVVETLQRKFPELEDRLIAVDSELSSCRIVGGTKGVRSCLPLGRFFIIID